MASPRVHLCGHTLRHELDRTGNSIANREDIPKSSPTITPHKSNSSNQSLAANLVTTLSTPRRPTPNSARKRRQMPDLSRPIPTPSHGAKMSMIFRDAADSLQRGGSPTCQVSSNIKKSRLPLPQARRVKFGSTCQGDTWVTQGLGSPSMLHQHSGELCEPDLASSEAIHYQTSEARPHYSTPTHLTKAGRAALRTTSNQHVGAAAGVGSVGLDESLTAHSASLSLQSEEAGKEPISSGFGTPIPPALHFAEHPNEVKYPILENRRLGRSPSSAASFGSDSDDLHSTHGVPFILPFPRSVAEETPCSDIDKWLNGITEAKSSEHPSSPKQSCDQADLLMNDSTFSRSIASKSTPSIEERLSPLKPKQEMISPSGASSDKENVSPLKSPSLPTSPRAHHPQARTLSRFSQANPQATPQHVEALQFTQPQTPQVDRSAPPKRKKARIDGMASSRARGETPTIRRDFTIHEDQLAEALAQLSPDVELHRRGRGPRRERCVSYWDKDILQSGLQCVPMDVDSNGETMGKDKRVLVGSKQAGELTTNKPFVNKAGSASS